MSVLFLAVALFSFFPAAIARSNFRCKNRPGAGAGDVAGGRVAGRCGVGEIAAAL